MSVRHRDEAIAAAIRVAAEWLAGEARAKQFLLVDDLAARLHAVVWPGSGKLSKKHAQDLGKRLAEAAGPFWSGDVTRVDEATQSLFDGHWERAEPRGTGETGKLRFLVRPQDHLHWFEPPRVSRAKRSDRPPVVAFLSFKGGVGRTTALAAFAIRRARKGDHVVAIDMDLDAPGLGSLLRDPDAPTACYGLVDFLLESPWVSDLDLDDYLHRCGDLAISDRGWISVMPAGTVDGEYLGKLARADLDGPSKINETRQGLDLLLELLEKRTRRPDWILIDCRAGLSSAAGLATSGIADLHVLVATASEQSYLGLERLVHHLGARVLRSSEEASQAECLVVQSMVPDNTVVARKARDEFAARVEDIFRDHYYAAQSDRETDRWWSLDDMGSPEAPHQPVSIDYRGTLAFFGELGEVAELLASDVGYTHLEQRILASVGVRGEDHDSLDE